MRIPSPLLLLLLFSVIGLRPVAAQDDGPTDSQYLFVIKEVKPDVERIGIIWSDDAPDREARMSRLARTAANLDIQLVVATIGNLSDVASEYRRLVRDYDVDVLWVADPGTLIDAGSAQRFLVENAAKGGLPLIAPSSAWVQAGAPLTVLKRDGQIRLLVNEAAAQATALAIPDKYTATAEFLATN